MGIFRFSAHPAISINPFDYYNEVRLCGWNDRKLNVSRVSRLKAILQSLKISFKQIRSSIQLISGIWEMSIFGSLQKNIWHEIGRGIIKQVVRLIDDVNKIF